MLRNQTIVITGASSGFGQGSALRFAKEGANLVLAARRKDLLDETAKKCRRKGAKAIAVETDVSDPEQVRQLAETAVNEFGRIHIWVNDAGVSTFGRFDEIPWREHDQVIRTNLLGCMAGSYVALRHFRKSGQGTLINISSLAGVSAAPYQSSYTASKHGIRGLDMALRQELYANGEHNIHVCTVMPASIDTPFFEHAANHTGRPVKPIPPVYDPEDVVDAIYRMATRPEDEVMVGAVGKMTKALGKVAPKAAEHMMARNTHKAQMEQSDREADSEGNVFQPLPDGREMYGGWNSGKAGKIASAVLAGVTVGALGFLFSQRRGGNADRNWSAA